MRIARAKRHGTGSRLVAQSRKPHLSADVLVAHVIQCTILGEVFCSVYDVNVHMNIHMFWFKHTAECSFQGCVCMPEKKVHINNLKYMARTW